MARRTSPVLLRRQLGELLKEHREATGEKAFEVAKALRINPSVISRLENGHRRPILVYVSALCSHYRLDKTTTDEVMKIAMAAYEEGWWERAAVMGDEPSEYVGFEAGASGILTYELGYVPGLMQGMGYAKSVISRYRADSTDEQVSEEASLRLRRQEILTSEDAVRLHAVVHESVLRDGIAEPSIMLEQLLHLQRLAALPNVRLQVLRSDSRNILGRIGGFSILEFSDGSTKDLAYAETILGAFNQRREEDVAYCKYVFAEIAKSAAGEAESAEFIAGIVREVDRELKSN